jgi:hypothetical protein
MRDSTVRALGLACALAYSAAIVWVYARQPQTFAEATGSLAASVGAYHIDEQAFADGLEFFHKDEFAASRLAFARADPALQDARTQFYIAYSYYREGWGRVYVDKELFARALEALNRAIAAAPRGRIVVDDSSLQIHSGDELKAEIDADLQARGVFNPLTLATRRRK